MIIPKQPQSQLVDPRAVISMPSKKLSDLSLNGSLKLLFGNHPIALIDNPGCENVRPFTVGGYAKILDWYLRETVSGLKPIEVPDNHPMWRATKHKPQWDRFTNSPATYKISELTPPESKHKKIATWSMTITPQLYAN